MQTVTEQVFALCSRILHSEVRLPRKRWLLGRVGVLAASVLVIAGFFAPALAQHEVTGVVRDSVEGRTLPGVNIVVQGTQIGTTTRGNGTFTLEAPSEEETLVFSFVGYEEKEVPIEGRSELTVDLAPSVTALEEVVVNVGYQEQTVATTTGSVSQVSGEDLNQIPVTNLSQSLQGTIPGVMGISASGRPGFNSAELRIRGVGTLNNNSPLVVIDGVPARQGGLGQLDPSNIENISVLKDASAAIYGSRAANGVILVQTKGGQAGQTTFDVNVERRYAQPTIVPEMADAPTYMRMLNEVDQYGGNPPRFSEEDIQNHTGDLSDSWQYHNTDWYDVALKDFSKETSFDVSASGGSEAIQYRVALNGLTENGILVNSGMSYDQLGFRSNVTGDVTDNFELSLNVHGRLEDRTTPSWTRGLGSAWEMLQRGKPIDPAFWPNGQPGPAQEQGVNPVVANKTGYDERKNYFFQSDLTLNFDIPGVDGWTADGTVSYDHEVLDRRRWQEPWTLYSCLSPCEGADNLQPVQTGVADPRLNEWDNSVRDIMLRATTTYEETFDDHSTSLLLGTEYQKGNDHSIWAFRRYFPTDQIQELFAGGTSQQDMWGSSSHSARLNFFTRANYNYQEKYLIEFVARYDGSYIFPEGDRFGFFPSVSAGWRLAQEDWFNEFTGDVFSRLKLRASYGQVGNDQVDPYQFMRTFGFNGNFAYADGLGTRIAPTRVPNQDITWEVATKTDVGLSGSVLGDRLSFDLTWYRQSRDDILWWRSAAVPQTAGFSLPRENIAKVDSWGYEGELSFSQPVSEELTVRAGVNLSYTANEVEYFAEAEGLPEYQQQTGAPWETNLYYVADGIWQTQDQIDNAETHWPGARPGDIRFKDINGDGEINGQDQKRIKENEFPDVQGSFNLGATYGPVSTRVLFQGATQARRYVFTGAAGAFGNYFQHFAENRWTPDNTDASGPRAYNRQDPYWASNQNTYFLRDAKYLRLKSARIGYTLPQGLTEQAGVGQLQLYLSGRNLLTWTPLEVIDPELQNGAAQQYPSTRAYTMGIQMQF